MKKKNHYQYKFSVIIPIYKVEKYLEETIQSVINQTIGFEENIQMILVNDGSPDSSEKICLKYKELYPENIVYVEQENTGVSAARNHGMEYIKGKYTNFLDSDDKWNLDAFKIVYDFFEKNYDRINLVACRMKFFEARNDYHALDYKFTGNRIIDINQEHKSIHLHITSSFIKSEILSNYQFDTGLRYGEDAKFVSKIILDKKKYGIVSNTTLYYRKRANNSSAVQQKLLSTAWYTDTPEYYYNYLMKYSKEKYGKILPYVQFIVMYDIQWRLRENIPERQRHLIKNYVQTIKKILMQIDNSIICEPARMFTEFKVYALNLKYGKDILQESTYHQGKLFFNDIFISNLKKKMVTINILDIAGDNLILEGTVSSVLSRVDYSLYFLCNTGEKYYLELFELPFNTVIGVDGRKILQNYGFKVTIPLKKVETIKFVFKYKNTKDEILVPKFGKFGKLNKLKTSYFSKQGYIVKNGKELHVYKNSLINRVKVETRYLLSLFKRKKIKAILYRIIYWFLKIFIRKPIWLITDRKDIARDNGEAFFDYLQKRQKLSARPYFVISSKSDDYQRIKKMGKVIKEKSLKHKLYFLLSDKIISSQANEREQNVFGKGRYYLKDLYKFDFIFLQHGITINDLSSWLFKTNKNLQLFITASKKEYDSILKGNYGYDKNVVRLTGFSRFDKLESNPQNTILILPTWRRKLAEWCSDASKEQIYNASFKESDFYKFYNKLINEKRIHEALERTGYRIKFCLHPLLRQQAIDFEGNKYVSISTNPVSYQKEFSENALLITDYSSVFFDFSYLKKPVIYTQFDKEKFYEGQIYDKGYFDYEGDGFGPVCYDYESTVEEIIAMLLKNCKIEEKYLTRIEKFYYKFDKNNSERIYQEILKLDRRKNEDTGNSD